MRSTLIGRVLYGVLKLGAKAAGASLEELLRSLLEREEEARRDARLDRKLADSRARLAAERQQGYPDDVKAFARAETEVDDPLRSTRAKRPDA